MDPIEPWIDGDAVRRLADQLISTPSTAGVRDDADAGFGPVFEGFTQEGGVSTGTVAPPADEIVEEPRDEPAFTPIPEPVVEKPAVEEPLAEKEPVVVEPVVEEPVPSGVEVVPTEAPPAVEARPQAIVKEVPGPEREPASGQDRARGPLMERMYRFRDWLKRHAHARSVFVLDRDGNPVLDDPAYSKLFFLAKSLSQAYRPVSGQAGNVHVKVGSDAYLVVIPAETDFGRLVLGTVLQRPLNAESVEVVARVLGEAVKPVRRDQSAES